MSAIRFLWVGRLKEPFAAQACEHYMKKLGRFHKFEETVVKDAPGKLPPAEKSANEGRAILERLGPKDLAVCLDEHGREPTSVELAALLTRWIEAPGVRPCFIIGGPFGLSDEVKAAAAHTLCLSRMTLPHELARILLLEQLYRAASINRGLPYHHV